MSTANYEDAVI